MSEWYVVPPAYKLKPSIFRVKDYKNKIKLFHKAVLRRRVAFNVELYVFRLSETSWVSMGS